MRQVKFVSGLMVVAGLSACVVAAPPPAQPAPVQAAAGADAGADPAPQDGGAAVEAEGRADVERACAAAGGTLSDGGSADVEVCVGPDGARVFVRGVDDEDGAPLEELLPD